MKDNDKEILESLKGERDRLQSELESLRFVINFYEEKLNLIGEEKTESTSCSEFQLFLINSGLQGMEVAKKAGLNPGTIYSFKSGYEKPSSLTLFKINKALGTNFTKESFLK